jgi:hypothetical protein
MVDFVVELRPEQLEMIAGEDTVSISRRAALKKERACWTARGFSEAGGYAQGSDWAFHSSNNWRLL